MARRLLWKKPFGDSETVTNKRRLLATGGETTTTTMTANNHREEWAKRMSLSMSDLLDDKSVDSLELNHMTIRSRRRPNWGRGISMPILQNLAAAAAAAEHQRQNQEEGDRRPPSPAYLPRFSNIMIVSKEDMECRLEEFRVRMMSEEEDQQRQSSFVG